MYNRTLKTVIVGSVLAITTSVSLDCDAQLFENAQNWINEQLSGVPATTATNAMLNGSTPEYQNQQMNQQMNQQEQLNRQMYEQQEQLNRQMYEQQRMNQQMNPSPY